MQHRASTIERWEALAASALKLIRENATAGNAISVAEIARQLGISTRLLQQVLSREGVRFAASAREAKLDRAGILMIQGHRVDDAAARVGYEGTSALRAAFKKQFGVPPSEFRYAANLYQRLLWNSEHDPGISNSAYSAYRVRTDKRELESLLKSTTVAGQKLLRAHARASDPRRRRFAAPMAVRRRTAPATADRDDSGGGE